MICPKDFKPCCDDLCYGGGCILMDGAAMYEECPGCGKLISENDHDNCICEPDDYDYSDDDMGRK